MNSIREFFSSLKNKKLSNMSYASALTFMAVFVLIIVCALYFITTSTNGRSGLMSASVSLSNPSQDEQIVDGTHRRDISDFVNDHTVAQSTERAREEGTHERVVSDFVDDHTSVQSAERAREEGTHDEALSRFIDDHDTNVSIERDREEGTHDEEFSAWVDDDSGAHWLVQSAEDEGVEPDIVEEHELLWSLWNEVF